MTLGASGGWQYVRGATKTDADGPRTATMIIQPNTNITSCVGTTACSAGEWSAGNSVQMHATEFTVGEPGLLAMPGALPPQRAYTYAVDTGIIIDGQPIDTSVVFDRDILFYVEDFTQMSVDATNVRNGVPYGTYDKSRGLWQPEVPGKIYCIIDLGGVDGSVTEARLGYDCQNEIGTGDAGGNYSTESPPIAEGERAMLASVYAGGTFPMRVWRAGLPHFSGLDYNWTSGPPVNAPQPPNIPPTVAVAKEHPDCSAVLPGSSIECQNQVLGESIPLVGTPYSLHYRSENQNGYRPTITVPYTDDSAATWTPPDVPVRIEIEVDVAGQSHTYVVGGPYKPNQSISYSWDRNDVYGRPIQGSVTAQVRVGYVYAATPSGQTSTFGAFGVGVAHDGNRSTREVTINRNYSVPVHVFDNKILGFGGWTLSAQNVYEPLAATLWMGNGTKREASAMASVATTLATLSSATGVLDLAATPDNSIFAAVSGANSGS